MLLPLFLFIFPLLDGKEEENFNLRLTLIPLEQFLIPSSQFHKYGYDEEKQGNGSCFWWIPLGDWGQCSEECGGCGKRWRRRECRRKRVPNGVEECSIQCEGPEFEEEFCNFDVCLYPKQHCCPPLVPSSVKGNFSCAFPMVGEGMKLGNNKNESATKLAKLEFFE